MAFYCNAQMSTKLQSMFAVTDKEGLELLKNAMQRLNLSHALSTVSISFANNCRLGRLGENSSITLRSLKLQKHRREGGLDKN
jgi:hypothetical protein